MISEAARHFISRARGSLFLRQDGTVVNLGGEGTPKARSEGGFEF